MQKQGFFTVSGRSIYGSMYLPESGKADLAVVLCEPFGEEKRCAFRMLVRLGKKLAENGVACLRFDVSGTGDSCGDHSTAQWNNWSEETAAAVEFAKQMAGANHTAIFGFRAGAMLAAQAAATSAKLALIEPVLSGAELLNDLERRQKIKDMMNASNVTPPPEGMKDFGGFAVSDAMAAQLKEASLLASCKNLSQTSISLIRVSAAKTFPPAWKELVELAQNSPNGNATIIADKPFWGQVDYFESDAIIDPLVEFAK